MIGVVLLGGAIGALVRYFVERGSVRRFGERIPYGTFVVNALGSLALGAAVGLHERGQITDTALLLVGTGFCGALTTFSGWAGQIYTRGRHLETRMVAAAYLGISVFVGVVLAWLGYRLAG